MATTPTTRHCTRCGLGDDKVKFRSELALKCEECDKLAKEEKRQYHRRYHAARHRAVQALIGLHRKQFKSLMTAELEKPDEELGLTENGKK